MEFEQALTMVRSGLPCPDSAGIGLSLAKEVIQKQNGSIEASGAEGEGTAFHIRFFQTGTL